MKKIIFLLISLLITTVSFGQELVVNGGFEDVDGTAWEVEGNVNLEGSWTDWARTGLQFGILRDGLAKISQPLTVTVGDTYTLNAYYQYVNTDVTVSTVSVYYVSAADPIYLIQQDMPIPDPKNYCKTCWDQHFTEDFTVPPGVTSVILELFHDYRIPNSLNNQTIWDDVSVIEKPTVGEVPIINCPVDIIADSEPGVCGAVVNFADPSAIDPDGTIVAITQTEGTPLSGEVFPVGVTYVQFCAEDNDGNIVCCDFTVTVNDVEDPVAVCQDLTVELDASGSVIVSPADFDAGSTDNCEIAFTFGGSSLVPGSLTSLFVSNNGGNDGGAVYFDVTVGSSDIEIDAFDINSIDTGAITMDVYTLVGTSVGNETDPSAWTMATSGSGTGAGLDNPSNMTLNSTITLSANTTYGIALVLDASHGHNYTNGDGSNEAYSNDDLSIALGSASNVPFTAGIYSPRVFNGTIYYQVSIPGTDGVYDCSEVGEHIVTLLVTDASGNTASCMATVTVEDNQAPVIVCKGSGGTSTEVETFEGATIPAGWTTEIVVGAQDWAFGSGDLPYVIPEEDFPTNAAIFDDDAAGNGSANFARLISPVYDLTGVLAAEISFDYYFRQYENVESLSAEVWDGAAWQEVFFVNTDGPIANSGAIDVLAYANAAFQVRFNYDDAGAWGYAAGIDNVTISYEEDGTPPLELVLDADGHASVDLEDLFISIDDNCNYTIAVGGGSGGGTACEQSNPSNNWENGFNATGAFLVANDVTVDADVDFSLEQLTANLIHLTGETIASVNLYYYDNSAGQPGTEIGNQMGVVPTSQTVLASGLFTSYDGSEVVFDLTPFTFASQTGTPTTYWVVMEATSSAGGPVFWETTTVSFNGESALVFSSGAWVVGDPLNDGVYTFSGTCGGSGSRATTEFDCSNLGENQVDVTVTDAGGNTATCTATVIVTDETAPVVVCGSSVTVELDENGEYTVMPEDVTTTLEDSCGLDVVLLDLDGYTDTTVTCADIGLDIQATVFANDASGNFASCQTTITVVDTMAPELTCPDASYETEPSNNDGVYVVRDYYGIGAATYSDNCTDMGTLVVTQDPAPGTQWGINGTGNPGPYVVTFTVEDESGNVVTCTLDVIVINGIGVTENTLLDNALGMYPNPATDMVKLVNTSDIALESAMIYDINGKLVTELDLNNMGTETTFDVSQFANGVYMVKIIGENASTVKRLIKE